MQREFLGKTVVDVAYVGSQSRHLPRRSNLNSIPFDVAFKASAQDPTGYAGGVIPATEPKSADGVLCCQPEFHRRHLVVRRFLRPYQGYADITLQQFRDRQLDLQFVTDIGSAALL